MVIGVGFEVLTAVSTKMAVFWVVAPCTRLHGATTQKTAIIMVIGVRKISNNAWENTFLLLSNIYRLSASHIALPVLLNV
jgi:hypothetical protein